MAIGHESAKLLHLRHLGSRRRFQGSQRLGAPTPAVVKIFVHQKKNGLDRFASGRFSSTISSGSIRPQKVLENFGFRQSMDRASMNVLHFGDPTKSTQLLASKSVQRLDRSLDCCLILHVLSLHKHAPDHHAWLGLHHQKRSGSLGVLTDIFISEEPIIHARQEQTVFVLHAVVCERLTAQCHQHKHGTNHDMDGDHMLRG